MHCSKLLTNFFLFVNNLQQCMSKYRAGATAFMHFTNNFLRKGWLWCLCMSMYNHCTSDKFQFSSLQTLQVLTATTLRSLASQQPPPPPLSPSPSSPHNPSPPSGRHFTHRHFPQVLYSLLHPPWLLSLLPSHPKPPPPLCSDPGGLPLEDLGTPLSRLTHSSLGRYQDLSTPSPNSVATLRSLGRLWT